MLGTIDISAEHQTAAVNVRLRVTNGPHKGSVWLFQSSCEVIVGRDHPSQIRLPNERTLSRKHFLLTIGAESARIVDLQSRNGTWMNGVRVAEANLVDEDSFGVGETRFRIEILPPETVADGRAEADSVYDRSSPSPIAPSVPHEAAGLSAHAPRVFELVQRSEELAPEELVPADLVSAVAKAAESNALEETAPDAGAGDDLAAEELAGKDQIGEERAANELAGKDQTAEESPGDNLAAEQAFPAELVSPEDVLPEPIAPTVSVAETSEMDAHPGSGEPALRETTPIELQRSAVQIATASDVSAQDASAARALTEEPFPAVEKEESEPPLAASSEPAKPEPTKPEPVKPEPAKPEPSFSGAQQDVRTSEQSIPVPPRAVPQSRDTKPKVSRREPDKDRTKKNREGLPPPPPVPRPYDPTATENPLIAPPPSHLIPSAILENQDPQSQLPTIAQPRRSEADKSKSRSTDQRSTDQRSTDQRSTDQRSTDQRSTDQRSTDQRSTGQRSIETGSRGSLPTEACDTHDFVRGRIQLPKKARFTTANGQTTEFVGVYELIRVLGQGGMATVFEARHRPTGEPRAIKLIRNDLMLSDEKLVMSLFAREASLTMRLSHPRIVKAYDFGMQDGSPYLVMELIPTTDIFKMLDKHDKPNRIRISCWIISRILQALNYAHDQGVVHRDIKPSNILAYQVERRLQVKLGDFGLAKPYDAAGYSAITDERSLRGTLAFMAPEHARDSRTAGPAADLYACGACLYNLLTGSYPVSTGNERAFEIALSKFTFLPPPLVEILKRSMQAEPDKRFRSAEEMNTFLLPFHNRI